MKKKSYLFVSITFCTFLLSACGMLGRTATKYWTKEQINEFITNCESKARVLLGGEEQAKTYCDCAVDLVAAEYQDFEEVKNTPIKEVLKVAKDCR